MGAGWNKKEVLQLFGYSLVDLSCIRTTLPNQSKCLLPTDMQKFPLRMKDNDLLVTELYHDPSNDAITALSVYLTPKTSQYSIFISSLKVC